MDWEDVRFFLALARHGSLSAAARALRVNHATVSRRVTALEGSLGAVLLERRPTGYVPTEAGNKVLVQAAAMAEAAEGLRRGGGKEASGLVRLTATRSLGEGFLLPHLAEFQRRHADIDVELISDSRSMSLARFEADLALRLARPADGDVKALRLATLTFGLYANDAWRQRLADGEPPCFVGFDEGNAHIPEAAWLARRFPQARLTFRVSNHLAQRDAVAAGMGIAVLPRFLAEPALRRWDGPDPPPDRELWMLWRPDAAPGSATRLLADFLRTLFMEQKGRF
ncbi:MAG TPA: LysR family transcriptional regulator [Candidatus Sulfotelmatobacter sp.]|jgi:DNA-binding transcriptional LysR family regulator|nr:LysR family transcriptional regulator [Candidatus Sulfotelmatobacter sp.]